MPKPIVNVSILATNYNNGKFLKDFFNSIIHSTVQAQEFVFVDDGSTDNSVDVLEEFLYLPYLKVIKFETNKGRAEALNVAKKNCTSEYILIIDPDDILLPDRIEKQYNFMNNNPEIDVLGGNVMYFNSKTGKTLNVSNFPQTHSEIYKTYYRGENGVLQPTVCCKRIVLQKYDYKQIFPGEDYELFAQIAESGYKFAALKEPVNRMRIHTDSSVSNVSFQSFIDIYAQRDKIFETKSSKIKVYFYYLHIKYYRLSMFTENFVKKIFYLCLSVISYPQKIIKRIF